MKKTFTFITAAATVLAMASCSNSEDFEQSAQQSSKVINLTLNATRGEVEATTRTAISYNEEYASLESTWSAGDKIYVYSRKSGAQIGTLTQTGTIINQKNSFPLQYDTSYATFSGSVTLGSGDAITDDYAFVYQGSGRNLTVADGKLSYELGYSATIPGLNAWDVAYATGTIQNTTDLEHASCAVTFTNKLAFGYFTTTGCGETNGTLTANYYNKFTLDVKTGTLAGISGTVSIPANNAGFYMPLVPGTVKISTTRTWSQKDGKWGYGTNRHSRSFTAEAGYYYRLGRNASTSFGPVPFYSEDWVLYETLKNSKFSVSADKEVYFTQGNLQYIGTAATPYWRVAEDQYSYLGTANAKPADNNSGTKFTGDIDYFGWGEVGTVNGSVLEFLGSNQESDYQSSITTADVNLTIDWATKFNNNSATLYAEAGQAYPKNGTGDYCCLTKDEWDYLFGHQYWGFATVSLNGGGTVNGLVICPNTVDESTAKTYLTSTVYNSSDTQTKKTNAFSENTITQQTIDENGLLFLPAAGYRVGTTFYNVNTYGYYWTTTSSSDKNAYYMRFCDTFFNSYYSYKRCNGYPVRLCQLVPAAE